MSEQGQQAKRWTKAEDKILRQAVSDYGEKDWKGISSKVGSRTVLQCFNRWQKVLRPGLTKGHWTPEEDKIILQCINEGITKWAEVSKRIPGRVGKQCRERYCNHLDPKINKAPWTKEEDKKLFAAHAKYGNKWALITRYLPGRPENSVKNRWNLLYSKTYKAVKTKHVTVTVVDNSVKTSKKLTPNKKRKTEPIIIRLKQEVITNEIKTPKSNFSSPNSNYSAEDQELQLRLPAIKMKKANVFVNGSSNLVSVTFRRTKPRRIIVKTGIRKQELPAFSDILEQEQHDNEDNGSDKESILTAASILLSFKSTQSPDASS